ncbi:AtpZ/AtpI family protein [bacterium]|nr:AtpZ/AtpI family protein [bacterium]
MRFSHVGLQFALTVGILVALGIWADKRLGTTPLFALLGVGVGFGIGFYHLYRAIYGVENGTSGKGATRGAHSAPGRDPEDADKS